MQAKRYVEDEFGNLIGAAIWSLRPVIESNLRLTLSLPECLMEFCKVTLTFDSVDKILWCDHSNESSLPVLTHGAICFSKFHKMKCGNLVEICFRLNLAVKRVKWFFKAIRQYYRENAFVTTRVLENNTTKSKRKVWKPVNSPMCQLAYCHLVYQ